MRALPLNRLGSSLITFECDREMVDRTDAENAAKKARIEERTATGGV
jgi:hypothetical protein